MIKMLPVKPRRQGNFCALDAARRNSKKFAEKFAEKLSKKLSKKRQTKEFCSAYFSEPALDCVFT
jgi:hypothetical protein